MGHPTMFRYTLLLNNIEFHQEDQNKWSLTHVLNVNTKSDYVTLTLDIGAHVHILHPNRKKERNRLFRIL